MKCLNCWVTDTGSHLSQIDIYYNNKSDPDFELTDMEDELHDVDVLMQLEVDAAELGDANANDRNLTVITARTVKHVKQGTKIGNVKKQGVKNDIIECKLFFFFNIFCADIFLAMCFRIPFKTKDGCEVLTFVDIDYPRTTLEQAQKQIYTIISCSDASEEEQPVLTCHFSSDKKGDDYLIEGWEYIIQHWQTEVKKKKREAIIDILLPNNMCIVHVSMKSL